MAFVDVCLKYMRSWIVIIHFHNWISQKSVFGNQESLMRLNWDDFEHWITIRYSDGWGYLWINQKGREANLYEELEDLRTSLNSTDDKNMHKLWKPFSVSGALISETQIISAKFHLKEIRSRSTPRFTQHLTQVSLPDQQGQLLGIFNQPACCFVPTLRSSQYLLFLEFGVGHAFLALFSIIHIYKSLIHRN